MQTATVFVDFGKDQRKVAEGLAQGMSQRQAVHEAGYSYKTAEKKAYSIVKRPLVLSALTEALERQGVTFDQILKPVVEALDAKLVVRTMAGAVKTKLPDHHIRLEAHDRLVKLYGGNPRANEIPPMPSKGLVVIIQKEGSQQVTPTANMTPKTQILPIGEGKNPPLPVRIVREIDP